MCIVLYKYCNHITRLSFHNPRHSSHVLSSIFSMAETPKKETVEVVLKNWRAEVETARVYRDLAQRESDEKRKAILIRMAEAEERHAQRWEQKLRDMGQPIPTLADTFWTRLQRRFTRSLGTDIAIRRMEAAEEKHEREFSAQRDRALAGEQ